MERIYLTTPIYYVNARPHIGHAYTTVLGDVLARYHRVMGEPARYMTGTDEHGQKVEEAARKRGVTPQAHVDELQDAFRRLWPTLGIQTDDFIRTTEPRHVQVVRWALQTLYDRGEIYEREYEGWYSASVERFWTEKDLVDGRCPESGGEVVFLSEKNYWFRMSKYQDRLVAHLQANPDFILPTNRRNEVLGFLAQPMLDLCISRPKERLAWGIELPFDSDYVTYVWFDALLNYVTSAGYLSNEEQFNTWWPHAVHLLGKDILTTHCVYWNTMLMALELPLPKHFVAHGWWLVDQTKMSKSLGNVVDPERLRDVYGVDSTRYFLMRDMVLGLDATFSEEALVTRVNAELANDLGNLVSRATKLLGREPFGAVVPELGADEDEDEELMALMASTPERVRAAIAEFRVHSAIDETMVLVRRLNKYINETKPFHVVKTDVARAGGILRRVLEGLRVAATCLYPVMPTSMAALLADIGASDEEPTLAALTRGGLTPGAPVHGRAQLFPRLEVPEPVEAAKSAAIPPKKESSMEPANRSGQDGAAAAEAAAGKAIIAYDDFAKLELVVVEIVGAEAVPKSNKLLRLEVDLGTEVRQVVSGIAKHYDPERLVGRRAVLLKNLAPRKVFGIESQGMLLAGEDAEGNLALITPEAYLPPGSEVS